MQKLRAACILLTWSATAGAAGIRDESPHVPPAITLPAAGGSYIDPVFGTRVLRVTDEKSGRLCVHSYSYWPALNLDSTRLLIACDNLALLYRFDGKKAVPDGRLSGDDGPKVEFDGASWSNLSPNVIYALDGMKLWRLDVSRRGAAGAKMVHDFTGIVPYAFVVAQLTMSADDRVFSFHTRDPKTGAKLDALTFDAATGRVRLFPRGDFAIDESKIDKSGRWVMVDGAVDGFKLWDLESGDVLSFEHTDADARPGGHADLGRTVFANSDGWKTGVQVRSFSAPLGAANLKNIVTYPNRTGGLNWTLGEHVSLRSDAETFVVVSTYLGDGSYNAFEDEIFLAFTDGSGFVRLAHSRSTEANPNSKERYWSQPRATVDHAGRWVVWTSDLGSSTRTDVLMVEIPSEFRPPAPVPAAPADAPPADPAPADPAPVDPAPADPAPADPVPAPEVTLVPTAPPASTNNGTAAAASDPAAVGAAGCSVLGRAHHGQPWSWVWLLVVALLIVQRRRRSSRRVW